MESYLTSITAFARSIHVSLMQLMITMHDFLLRLDKKHQVDTPILDFSNAFDTFAPETLETRNSWVYMVSSFTGLLFS